MAHILSSKTRPTTVSHTVTDDTGVERVIESVANVIHEVTFMLDKSTPHTLTFHPAGTIVSGEDEPTTRTVGDNVPLYEFADAAEAVAAYLDGKVI